MQVKGKVSAVPRKDPLTVPHFRSFPALAAHITTAKLGRVDSREWREEWAERWVVYADLVAFASRALRSETVVLNNIIRFDRASTLVTERFPNVTVRRFSDATFAIAATFHQAVAFGVALSHACLAFNREYLDRGTKPFFIHLIAPRVTIAHGQVLLLPSATTPDPRLDGIDPRNIIAGSRDRSGVPAGAAFCRAPLNDRPGWDRLAAKNAGARRQRSCGRWGTSMDRSPWGCASRAERGSPLSPR